MYPFIKVFSIHIPTYGLCVCLAVILCAVLSFKKASKMRVETNDLLIVFAVSIGAGMFGGNLLYNLITYDFKTLWGIIISGNFSLLQKTGTVFYGGIIGGTLAAIITSKMLKMQIGTLEMCVVPYIPLGHAIGRIGCLLAGCCYGFSYQGIFAVSTKLNPGGGTFFPIQCVEAVCNLLIMEILLLYAKKKRSNYSITSLYLIMYSALRFFIEFFRGDDIRGIFYVFSTSQWISLIIFSISLIFYVTKCRFGDKGSEK